MSERKTANPDSLPVSALARVDEACDRFEAAWKAGAAPVIETFLADAPTVECPALLRALLALELELRCKRGDVPIFEEYLRRFPGQPELIRALFTEAKLPHHDSRTPFTPSTIPSEIPGERAEYAGGPPTAPLVAPLPERIGRYQIRRELGGGAFGKVYLAHDELMARSVALKVPSQRLLATQNARNEFLAEVRSVATLQHEGIVRAYDFGQTEDGLCYIVYEFIDGMSLLERIRPQHLAKDPLQPHEAARIVVQLAEALHYAHLRDLVHRDIKPANILLDRQGRARLTDFGLAVREEDLPRERGRLAGTRPYMSPEQVRLQAHHLDGRTDIYSLGVVLYELLCGRRPFEAETVDELEDQILHREPKPPRQIKDAIPPKLEEVCLRALAKRVQDRFPTAKDMAEAIEQAMPSGTPAVGLETTVLLRDLEQRLVAADADELRRLLRLVRQSGDPCFVPAVFRCLSHPVEAVRDQARKVVHAFGWDKVAAAAENLARDGDGVACAAVLDGLAAFEAHPQIVALLDCLLVLLQGDLRNRAILLLERKRLGLELDAVAAVFREIHSPYRIEKALGQGLFAANYLAHADGTELAVVVRVLRPELAGQGHVRARFLDLNKRALQIVHENVVLTREARAIPERNTYFAVQDYVDGVTLQKVLESGRRFDPPQIVQLLRQLLAALGAFHRRGLYHGGVKPSKAFVCADDRVVLGGATLPIQGIGLALERLSYDYRYAAPETFQNNGPVGPASDFYSLGCLAYELACGAPPFVSDHYIALAARHLNEVVVSPSQRGSRLGPAYDPILLKLLARSPAERYSQAEHVLRDLEMPPPVPTLPSTGQRPAPAPLLHDASLAEFKGRESLFGFDASASLLEGSQESLEHAQMSEPSTQMGAQAGPVVGAAAASKVDDMPEQPERIGDYDVVATLGRGGMGIVYKARDRRLNRFVALKVLPSSARGQLQKLLGAGTEAQTRLTRFRTEALAVARLQHPHIVQLYNLGEYNGLPYVVLEYVDGGSLAAKLRRDSPTPRAAAELVVQLARAVQHAHEQGVLHRDLKPSNVLLTRDGLPKIADFGLAKLQEMPPEDVYATQAGTILGTPAYMAPEQAAGDIKKIGPAADIHSLGAILYEMLTDRPPFRGENPMATVLQVLSQEAQAPEALNAAVPRDLSALCLKCLQKDPEQRYASAQALAEDLENWLAGKAIQARPPSLTWRLYRGWRRWLGEWFGKRT
jgi:serine/threonine protein kinase